MRTMKVTFQINNEKVTLQVRPYETLLETLRERLSLTGAKEACGMGSCGACTVVVNGIPLRSCLVLAPEVDGAVITTVEGLRQEGKLHPLQEAFMEKGRRSVRFLHLRYDHDGQGAPRQEQKTDQERDYQDDLFQYLPVHRIQEDRRGC